MLDSLFTQIALLAAQPTSWIGDIMHYFRNVDELLLALGPWMLAITCLMVFIESGVLFPFLPGDSLIFTAGLLHIQLGLNLWWLMLAVFVAAFLGDQMGYFLGYKFGRRFFKDDARVLKTEYLHSAEAFFDKHGGPALVLARFVPIVRTYVPLAAGIAKYGYSHFIRWNVIGAAAWGMGLTFLGSQLGGVAFIRNNIELLAMLIIFVSVLPIIIKGYQSWRKSKQQKTAIGAPESSANPE
ncbi:DedA family protein [Boudabousia liubingyangii]|uniref:DedA family protein n=1 Tax=Boudabousia liubingyangii TaxID=1921764 RepID=UPI0009F84888|nr:VTT domain-containing protein [Boudabousia liubingyangii]